MSNLEEIARRGNEIVQQRRRGEEDEPTFGALDTDAAWGEAMFGRGFDEMKLKPVVRSRIGTFGA